MNTVTLDGQQVYPTKVVCIGRNYVKHIAELNNDVPSDMVVFIKPNSAIAHSLASYHQESLHYEGELVFMVEKGQFVAVGFGLDLTKRALQSQLKAKGLPWERAKAFNGAAVIGDLVRLPDTVDMQTLSLELWIDDRLVQKGGVEEMLYPPEKILQELSQFTTLEDGDIVMTGTPEGVGELQPGAVFTGKVYSGDQLWTESSWRAQ